MLCTEDVLREVQSRPALLKLCGMTPYDVTNTWNHFCAVAAEQLGLNDARSASAELGAPKSAKNGVRLVMKDYFSLVVQPPRRVSPLPAKLFLPHPSFLQHYGLSYLHTRWHVPGNVRDVEINARDIANKARLSRDSVLTFLRAIMQIIGEFGQENQSVALTILGVGMILIDKRTVDFKWGASVVAPPPDMGSDVDVGARTSPALELANADRHELADLARPPSSQGARPPSSNMQWRPPSSKGGRPPSVGSAGSRPLSSHGRAAAALEAIQQRPERLRRAPTPLNPTSLAQKRPATSSSVMGKANNTSRPGTPPDGRPPQSPVTNGERTVDILKLPPSPGAEQAAFPPRPDSAAQKVEPFSERPQTPYSKEKQFPAPIARRPSSSLGHGSRDNGGLVFGRSATSLSQNVETGDLHTAQFRRPSPFALQHTMDLACARNHEAVLRQREEDERAQRFQEEQRALAATMMTIQRRSKASTSAEISSTLLQQMREKERRPATPKLINERDLTPFMKETERQMWTREDSVEAKLNARRDLKAALDAQIAERRQERAMERSASLMHDRITMKKVHATLIDEHDRELRHKKDFQQVLVKAWEAQLKLGRPQL